MISGRYREMNQPFTCSGCGFRFFSSRIIPDTCCQYCGRELPAARCWCDWCRGRAGIHGEDAMALYREQVAAASGASLFREPRGSNQDRSKTVSEFWQPGMSRALAQAEAAKRAGTGVAAVDQAEAARITAAILSGQGLPDAGPDWITEYWTVLGEPLGLADADLPSYDTVPPGACRECHRAPSHEKTRLCLYCQALAQLKAAADIAACARLVPVRIVRKRNRLGRITEITYRPDSRGRPLPGYPAVPVLAVVLINLILLLVLVMAS